MSALKIINRKRINKFKVGREEAIRIGQKLYYDPDYCGKDAGHVWVKIKGNSQYCHECNAISTAARNFKKNNDFSDDTQANADAIKKVQNKRDEIALSKMDDYDFDFDDE